MICPRSMSIRHLLTVLILGPTSFCPIMESSPALPTVELTWVFWTLLLPFMGLLVVLVFRLLLGAIVVLFLLITVFFTCVEFTRSRYFYLF